MGKRNHCFPKSHRINRDRQGDFCWPVLVDSDNLICKTPLANW